MGGTSFDRLIKIADRISRWLFVLTTWLICIVFIYDFWNVFQEFTWKVFLESSLPILIGILTVLVLAILSVYQNAWLLRLFVCLIFFLSIAVLYSYVGSKLSHQLKDSFSIVNQEPNEKKIMD